MCVFISRIVTRLARRMARRPAPFLFLCGLLTTVAVASAAQTEAPLSLAEALRLAEARSPQLASAEYAATAARERAVASSQLPDPVLRLGVDNLPINGTDAWSLTADFMTMRRVGVMQEFPDSEKRSLRRQRGDVEAERELAVRDAARSTLRQDVAVAWFDRFYAYRIADLWKAMAADLQLQATTLESGIASGRNSAADLRSTQALAVQSDDQIAASLQQARISEQMLARWLGKDATRAQGPMPDMSTVLFDPAAPAPLAAHAQLIVLQQDNLLAQNELRLAERAGTPDWSVEVAYQQRGPAYSNMVSIGVNIPLPLFPRERQDRGVAASQARLAQAETLLEDARQQRQADLSASYEEWHSLRTRVQSLRTALLPLADDRVAQLVAAYGGGSATLAQVLEARRAAIDARMQVLLLERDTARTWAKLNFQLIDPAANVRVAKDAP